MHTFIVVPFSRSSFFSPMQYTTLIPFLRQYASLAASISSVSPKYSRRSEWPMRTHSMPIVCIWSTASSPVYAPHPVKPQFCGQILAAFVNLPCTSGMWSATGHTYTSHLDVSHALMLAMSLGSAPGLAGLHFQLPPTIGLRVMSNTSPQRGHASELAKKSNVHALQRFTSGGR